MPKEVAHQPVILWICHRRVGGASGALIAGGWADTETAP